MERDEENIITRGTRHHGIYLQQMLVNAPLAVKQNNADD